MSADDRQYDRESRPALAERRVRRGIPPGKTGTIRAAPATKRRSKAYELIRSRHMKPH
jgi:hypothetical protein